MARGRRYEDTVEGGDTIIYADDVGVREIVMPHAVRFDTEASWKARKVRAANHQDDFSDIGKTSIFERDGRYVVVGSEANAGTVGRRSGPLKLEKGWLDLLLTAGLIKLFPNGHDNLVVGCAHTIDTTGYVESMAEAIGGVHNVKLANGKEVVYKVRAMVPFDEPAGGLFRFMQRNKQRLNEVTLNIGDKVLVIDIGGKISTMIPAEVLSGERVRINWDDGLPFDLGIQDVIKSLTEELHSLHPDKFRVRTIPDSILREALLTNGSCKVYNKIINVEQAVLNATAKLLDELSGVFMNGMENSLESNLVIITGGGGGLLFNQICESVITPLKEWAYLADEPKTINLANLRGGEFALSQWAVNNSGKVNQKGAKQPLTYMVMDPGNSDLKFKVVGAGYNAS